MIDHRRLGLLYNARHTLPKTTQSLHIPESKADDICQMLTKRDTSCKLADRQLQLLVFTSNALVATRVMFGKLATCRRLHAARASNTFAVPYFIVAQGHALTLTHVGVTA
jgi:hypothetical protein